MVGSCAAGGSPKATSPTGTPGRRRRLPALQGRSAGQSREPQCTPAIVSRPGGKHHTLGGYLMRIIDLTVTIANSMPAHRTMPRPIYLRFLDHDSSKALGLGTPDDPFTSAIEFMG